MPAIHIEPSDLRKHPPCARISEDLALDLIAGTIARATRHAPCITSSDLSAEDAAAGKDVLVNVIVRRVAAGYGGFRRETTTADGVTHTTEANPGARSLFSSADVADLQDICADRGLDMPASKPRYSFPDADYPVTS